MQAQTPTLAADLPIRYHGTKEAGYDATRGGWRVDVRRTVNGWEATYFGTPTLHNPIEKVAGDFYGRMTLACTAPTVTVGTDYRTRGEAAEAALAAQKQETLNWERAWSLAGDEGKERGTAAGFRRARELYWGQTADPAAKGYAVRVN